MRGRAHPGIDPPCVTPEPPHQDRSGKTSVDGPIHILFFVHLLPGEEAGALVRRLSGEAAFRGVVRGGEPAKADGATSEVSYQFVCGDNHPERVGNHRSVPPYGGRGGSRGFVECGEREVVGT